MKKILTILILAGTLSLAGFSQLPEADITIENPRIIGSTFYWDVYFMRTNNDPAWQVFGAATLGPCSWYFNFNLADLTNYQIIHEDPTLFPVGGNYTNTIGPNGGFSRSILHMHYQFCLLILYRMFGIMHLHVVPILQAYHPT